LEVAISKREREMVYLIGIWYREAGLGRSAYYDQSFALRRSAASTESDRTVRNLSAVQPQDVLVR
jgi:hypothetical protein